MKRIIFSCAFSLLSLVFLHAQDTLYGVYRAENQAEYDAKKRWIEVKRNKYQEVVISSESYNEIVGYYDEESSVVYYVIEKPAQYNTLMKIKFIDGNRIEIYVLQNNRWVKDIFVYRK